MADVKDPIMAAYPKKPPSVNARLTLADNFICHSMVTVTDSVREGIVGTVSMAGTSLTLYHPPLVCVPDHTVDTGRWSVPSRCLMRRPIQNCHTNVTLWQWHSVTATPGLITWSYTREVPEIPRSLGKHTHAVRVHVHVRKTMTDV